VKKGGQVHVGTEWQRVPRERGPRKIKAAAGTKIKPGRELMDYHCIGSKHGSTLGNV
jgi:hypothetical protein